MSKFFTKIVVSALLSIMLIAVQTVLADDEWKEITPAERQMKTAKVEADADAEVIFWEVRVDDGTEDLVMKHYIRVKVFNERGREKYSKVDIPFTKGTKIKEIMARVIKADGTIVELTKNDVFEREIVKTDKIKVKAKSFAVPNVEPGAIVEYRYKETIASGWANNMKMTFQHDVPIETISYYFRPALDAKYLTFNMNDNKFIKDKNGFYRATMENIPAIKAEAQMPPEDEIRSWLLLYYWSNLKDDSSDIWSKIGGAIARAFDIKDTLKPGKDIKNAAAEIAAGATTDDEKIAKVFEFCRAKVKNITYDTTLTDEQKEEIKPSKSASDTYKKLQGTEGDVNELFASLTTGLGFESRLAFSGDRSEMFFNPARSHASFVHFSSVAVKVNGQWKFYDPGNPFVSYGMLAWNEEDTAALLLGYKDYVTTRTSSSDTAKSIAKRTAKLKLLEDGTLEGNITVENTGQLGYESRMDNYKNSDSKREEDLKELIKKQMSTAEISDVKITNITDSQKPFAYQYKVRVPNYAQKTGKRLFLQPGFFEYGKSPLFSTATRKYDIYFHYPWSEQDSVEIELPKGFTLDSAEKPIPISDPERIGMLAINMRINNQTNVLSYDRKFHFGGNNIYLFPANAYPAIKNMFDAFHKADTHTVTLKQN